jgi:hypothetical protein
MSATTSVARLAAAGGVFLGLFALVFSAGSALGVWPAPPEGGYRGVDLAAGFAFGLVLLITLASRRRLPLG